MSDVLSDIFRTIRLKASVYFRTDFSAPWGILVHEHAWTARFHLIVSGTCHVRAAGQSLWLREGDFVLIPRGADHILADHAERTPLVLETVLEKAGYDGRGLLVIRDSDAPSPCRSNATQMICGHFGFGEGADHPLLRALPGLIHISAAKRRGNAFLDESLRLLADRVFSDGSGHEAAITRLSEIVFIEAIRSAVDDNPQIGRIMEAIGDAHIGKALELIHTQPERGWTVEGLAAEVGMSRTRFASRFSELLGDGPIGYLTEWRLQRALDLLSEPHANVQDVAGQVGYMSAAAFTRAFTQKFGTAPGQYRRKYA